jgi:hypothetical protein
MQQNSITQMKKHIFILFLFCGQLHNYAQTSNPTYKLQFIASEDSLPLSYATVQAISHGIIQEEWFADKNGFIHIKQTEITTRPLKIQLKYPGFAVLMINPDSLTNKNIFILKKEPCMLDQIEIVSYPVPWLNEYKKKQKVVDPLKIILYKASEIMAYSRLKKGTWINRDTTPVKTKITTDYEYFPSEFIRQNIEYPTLARDFLIEETIYIVFEFSNEGYVQKLRLLKGSSPLLALEVARVISRMPRIQIKKDPYSGEYLRPAQFLLPVKFKLK